MVTLPPDLTEIVSAEPTSVSDGARVVEMDGEWFIKWSPKVSGNDEAVLEYELGDADAAFDLDVTGIEAAKLTVNA